MPRPRLLVAIRLLIPILAPTVTLLVAQPGYGQIRSITVTPPVRNFGYFVGDVMQSETVIVTDAASRLDISSLPSPGPISTWIDLRAISVSQRQVGEALRVSIQTQYQSFYDPEEASATEVPGFVAVFATGTARVDARVPGWSFLASPFRHELQPIIDSSALKGEHPFMTHDLAADRVRCLVSVSVALVAAAMLAVGRGWIGALPFRNGPFGLAASRIGRMARARVDPRIAMQELHRAFDASAGRRLFAADLDAYLAEHQQFRRFENEIVAFFTASQTSFFGAGSSQAPSEGTVAGLATLSRTLGRAERGG